MINFILVFFAEMVDKDALGAAVEAQGDTVRKLKAEKADKAKVKLCNLDQTQMLHSEILGA
jgi:hypothetical protein